VGELGTHRRSSAARAVGAPRSVAAAHPGGPGHSRRGSASALSLDETRSLLAARLRERLTGLEAAIATRVYSIEDPRGVADPAYLQGLHAALAATVEYVVLALELGDRRAPSLPPALLAQVRLAARSGVALDTVLRRCLAGNALLDDLIVEEAELAEIPSATLRRLLASQATLFDRLLARVSAEYTGAVKNRPGNAAERRRECVKSLLAGELVDYSELGYDLEAHHLALIVRGEGGQELARELGAALDRNLLAVRREEEPIWACWLGGRRPLAAEQAVRALEGRVPERVIVAVGEPGEGLAGWRFSHRQAKAVLPVVERRGRRVLRYGDAALLASILSDDLIANSLRQLYLAPLERARDDGRTARATLRAYFASERNVSATAAALGVDRRTISNRLRAIEALLGRPLSELATDLEIALRLED
jgi:hypothetical protein